MASVDIPPGIGVQMRMRDHKAAQRIHCNNQHTLSLSRLIPVSSLSLCLSLSLPGSAKKDSLLCGWTLGFDSRCCAGPQAVLDCRGGASQGARFLRPKTGHCPTSSPSDLSLFNLRSRGVDIAGGGDGVGGQQGCGGLWRCGEEHAQHDLGPGEQQPEGVDPVHVGVVDGGAVDLQSSRGGSGFRVQAVPQSTYFASTYRPHLGQTNSTSSHVGVLPVGEQGSGPFVRMQR